MLIDADTRELTFELLLETNDPDKVDGVVMEVFPDYGNVVTSQMDYLDLKEQASSLKALVYKANTVNADLLAQVKKNPMDAPIADISTNHPRASRPRMGPESEMMMQKIMALRGVWCFSSIFPNHAGR